MSDVDHDDGFSEEAFKGLGEDPKPVTPPKTDPPATPGAAAEPPKADPPKPAEEPKKDDPTPPAEPPKKEEGTPPASDEKKPEEGAEPPKTPETPPTPTEDGKPLTEESLRSIINEERSKERTSGEALETATQEVLEAYYPDGLSNVLTDTNGKELREPQDVVDASGGQMDIKEAAQWLMNEQYKLDREVAKIKEDAKNVAQTTLKFKQDGIEVLQRYEPVFKKYPQLQEKVWKQYSKLVKADEKKGVILSAPDMREFYDTVLEPYRLAVEFSTGQPGTAPTGTPPETPPAPPAPSAEDRLDEGGDGGVTAPNDPNDFAQQVNKELAKGI